MEKKVPVAGGLPFLVRYRKNLVIVTVVAMATTALTAIVLGNMWLLKWLFGLGMVLTPITFIVGMTLYFNVYLTPSKLAARQQDFEKAVLEHDRMTAEIQVWREAAVRIGDASDRDVVNPTVQSLQRVIYDPHIPPDIKLEAKKRVSMSEDEP